MTVKKIFEKIVHTIVPHKKNKNIPHILKGTPILALLCFVLLLFVFVQKSPYIADKLNLTATVYPSVLAELANEDRENEGVKSLAWNDTLAEAARQKGEDMFAHQYFAHTSPDGLTPWYWLSALKYNFIYAGENLAIRFTDSEEVEKAWWNSPTHRANIVNAKFTEIGIAAVEGDFEGRTTTIVVEYFGTQAAPIPFFSEPAPTAVSPTPAPAPNPKPVVAGAENKSPVVAITPKLQPVVTPKVETIQEEEKFVAVKNVEAKEMEVAPLPSTPEPVPHVAWYQRFVVSPTNAVRTIYLAIISAIIVAMGLMLLNEFEKHHLKHLSLGVGLVAVVFVLLQFVGPGVALV
jgi:hypothetical protein